jgi:hypothetical protein
MFGQKGKKAKLAYLTKVKRGELNDRNNRCHETVREVNRGDAKSQ